MPRKPPTEAQRLAKNARLREKYHADLEGSRAKQRAIASRHREKKRAKSLAYQKKFREEHPEECLRRKRVSGAKRRLKIKQDASLS